MSGNHTKAVRAKIAFDECGIVRYLWAGWKECIYTGIKG